VGNTRSGEQNHASSIPSWVSKRYETKVRMRWGSFLISSAALKTPTRNGGNAQGVNLKFCGYSSLEYVRAHVVHGIH